MTEATYSYRALRTDGTSVTGTVTASSETHAAAVLTDRELFPFSLHIASRLSTRKRAIPVSDLALGLRILANLLDSGLPIGRTLDTFAELAPTTWEPGIAPMRDAIHGGKTLAMALGVSPLDVPPVIIGMLHAGEAGAGLASAVRRSAALMERTAATRSAIRNALAYPLVLAIAGTSSLSLLLIVVLPKFAAILHDLGQTLPRSTQLVINTATTIRAYAFPTACMIVASLVVLRFWTQSVSGRVVWHRWLRNLSVVGDIRRSAATARISAAMASLLESGVPVSIALTHASRAAGDAAVEAALLSARESVIHGERMSRAIDAADAMTPTAVRLLRAGEESGQLAQMFSHTATIEQERAEQRVRSVVRLLEPSLILAFGGAVAFVAAALLQAMYAVRPTG